MNEEHTPETQPVTPAPAPVTTPPSTPPTGKDTKKMMLWAVLAALVVAGLVFASYYFGKQSYSANENNNVVAQEEDTKKEAEKQDEKEPESDDATKEQPTTPSTPTDSYAGWQLFSATQSFASTYAFDFKFPSNWAFDASGKGSGCVLKFGPSNNQNYWVCLVPQYKNDQTIQSLATQELLGQTAVSKTDMTVDGHAALLVEHPGGQLIIAYIDNVKTGTSSSDEPGILIVYGNYRSGSDISYAQFKEAFTLLVKSVDVK